MKYIITITSLVVSLLSPLAQQDPEFMDLLALYVDEEYDKCLKKSLKYTDKEATRKHPLPYLYAAMSYFEISRDNKYKDDFPKAYKKALSYTGKYRKKDTDYTYKEDAESFIETFKKVLHEDIENYKLVGSDRSTRKIAGILKKAYKMDPLDRGVILLRGVYETKSKNKSEGKTLVKEGLLLIKDIDDEVFKNMTETQQIYLRTSLIEYALFIEEKLPSEAEEIIKFGKKYFIDDNNNCLPEDNEKYKQVFNKINS